MKIARMNRLFFPEGKRQSLTTARGQGHSVARDVHRTVNRSDDGGLAHQNVINRHVLVEAGVTGPATS